MIFKRWRKPFKPDRTMRERRIFVNPEIEKIENMTASQVKSEFDSYEEKIMDLERENERLKSQVDDADNHWKKKYAGIKSMHKIVQERNQELCSRIEYLKDYIRAQDTVLSKIGDFQKEDLIHRLVKEFSYDRKD